jgi:hypothetical protein
MVKKLVLTSDWSGRRDSNPRPQPWQGGETRPHSHRQYGVLLGPLVQGAPLVATIGPVVRIELERVEALELLGMTLAHLNEAETRAEMSPRVALLLAIRDKLALGLREEK